MKVVGIDWVTRALTQQETNATKRQAAKPRDAVFEHGVIAATNTQQWSLAKEYGGGLDLRQHNYPLPLEEGVQAWRICLEVVRPTYDLEDLETLWDAVNRNLTLDNAVWHCIHATLIDARFTGSVVEMYAIGTHTRPTVVLVGHQISLGRSPFAWEHTEHDTTEQDTTEQACNPQREPDQRMESCDAITPPVEDTQGDDGDLALGGAGADVPSDGSEPPTRGGGPQGDVPRSDTSSDPWSLPGYVVKD